MYNTDKKAWAKMIVRAMESENSWEVSAFEYLKLYK